MVLKKRMISKIFRNNKVEKYGDRWVEMTYLRNSFFNMLISRSPYYFQVESSKDGEREMRNGEEVCCGVPIAS